MQNAGHVAYIIYKSVLISISKNDLIKLSKSRKTSYSITHIV